MTIKQIQHLGIGAPLTLKTGNITSCVFLAHHGRDSRGKVLVSCTENLAQRFRVKPAALESTVKP